MGYKIEMLTAHIGNCRPPSIFCLSVMVVAWGIGEVFEVSPKSFGH